MSVGDHRRELESLRWVIWVVALCHQPCQCKSNQSWCPRGWGLVACDSIPLDHSHSMRRGEGNIEQRCVSGSTVTGGTVGQIWQTESRKNDARAWLMNVCCCERLYVLCYASHCLWLSPNGNKSKQKTKKNPDGAAESPKNARNFKNISKHERAKKMY